MGKQKRLFRGGGKKHPGKTNGGPTFVLLASGPRSRKRGGKFRPIRFENRGKKFKKGGTTPSGGGGMENRGFLEKQKGTGGEKKPAEWGPKGQTTGRARICHPKRGHGFRDFFSKKLGLKKGQGPALGH